MYPYITDNEGLNSVIPSFQNTVKKHIYNSYSLP